MSPRAYRLGQRQESSDKIRSRVVEAARKLLMARNGLNEFSMENVAQKAGVTRLTLYNQFGSKVGLLEGVYDDIARCGKIAERLEAAFRHIDPETCLDAVVEAFVQFWNAERLAIRRLRSMAVLNPDFKGATERDLLRRQVLETSLGRFTEHRGRASARFEETLDTLMMLTSFESFDTLAQNGTSIPKIVERIQSLVHVTLGKERKGRGQ
jgi:AcrR family transcriptional regulator